MSDIGNQCPCSEDENELPADDECFEVNGIEGENANGVNDEPIAEGSVVVPAVGMKFNNDNELFEFYKRYAFNAGFPVRKRNSRKGDDGMLRNLTFSCSHEGRRTSTTSSLNPKGPKPTIQTGCKARLTACSDVLGTWRITKIHLDHNHETSSSKSRLYRCNRQLSENVKRQLEVNNIAGIQLLKSYNSIAVEAGGNEKLTFVGKDCRNYIDEVKLLRLGEGDAEAIRAYLSKMQARCPDFYFSVDLDAESRLKNVFWCDNRCRQAYKEFGDVVTFDTSYLTNKYDMPFAPFVGVNHHGHSILFGCGLLSNEDTETFIWLFRTWLECMEGQEPIGIITDHDKAMQNAIQIVLPNTKHRWCLWHILKKLPEKIGYHALKGVILSTLQEVVYESQSPEVFEEGWRYMIDTYNLHDNDWLSGLYMERARWVPSFFRTSFWAGMSTTQQSESMSAFFDGYIHSKTSSKQFVEQYERAMWCKVEKEFQADFKSYSQMVPCATRFGMEKQIQEIYTISKFKEFQDELTGKMYCDVMSSEEGCLGTRYEVREDIISSESMKKKKFIVMFEREKCHAVCSCHLFEYRGIICRHAISVLIRNEVKLLPSRYILNRWRRDVCRAYTRVKIDYDGWVSTPRQLRYDQLCNAFAKVAHVVADDELQTRELMEWVESRCNDMTLSRTRMRTCCGTNLHSQGSVQIDFSNCEAEKTSPIHFFDPRCTKRKGVP